MRTSSVKAVRSSRFHLESVRSIERQQPLMSNTIRADKEASRRIECPMLHLWAERGPLDTFYAKDGGPLGIWRQWAPDAHGEAMKGGHFFPEENPDNTAVLVKQFLSA
jgi:pimeloyl-ACP methyl ester carboxylesterase